MYSESKYLSVASSVVICFLTMTFMWAVSQTHLRQTAMQFVGPALIVFSMHSIWAISKYGLKENVSAMVLSETLKTLTQLLALFLLLILVIPEPAVGSTIASEILSGIGIVLYCLVIIGIVGGIAGAIMYLTFKGIRWLYNTVKKDSKDSNKFNELVTLCIPFCLLFAASLEGVTGAYNFSNTKISSRTVAISSDVETVWSTLETATSPDFPLPTLLWMIPRPVEVLVDEGTAVGANRVVRFADK